MDLISFSAKLVDDAVEISWVTASEINSDYFLLQRSVDGVNFETIGKIMAQGNSADIVNYNFIDQNPIEGNNYYRLKQVDFNNEYEYFKTVVINTKNGNTVTRINVFPNPTNDLINLQLNKSLEGMLTCTIYDARGRVVYNLQIEDLISNQNLSINVSSLESGVYSVVLTSSNGFKSHSKFIKN